MYLLGAFGSTKVSVSVDRLMARNFVRQFAKVDIRAAVLNRFAMPAIPVAVAI